MQSREQMMDQLMDCGPGDECESTRQWKVNVAAFVSASTDDAAVWADAARLIGNNCELRQDIRAEGANVWTFWNANGFTRSRRYAALFNLEAK